MKTTATETLYDCDFHAWAIEQARRARAGEPIDAENVAEELESLGKSQRRELESRLIVLIAHRLKWEFQPHKRSGSWRATIEEQQRRIERHLDENPSLRPLAPGTATYVYPIAVLEAVREAEDKVEADFPARCPYTFEDLMRKPEGGQQ